MAEDDPFERDHAPPVGVPEPLAPGLRVVTAPNPGPMTFTGTRSYIVGEGEVAVIDPGPADPAHLAALGGGGRRRAGGGGARHPRPPRPQRRRPRLRGAGRGAGAGARAGARWRRRRRSRPAAARGGTPASGRTRRSARASVVAGPGWTLTALATPGHTADHLAFAWAEGGALFSGDHVMGWATTLISPPDGDLGAFRDSLRRLQGRPETVYYPGHGAPVADPQRIVAHILAHRERREAAIVAALARGPATVAGPRRGALRRRRPGACTPRRRATCSRI